MNSVLKILNIYVLIFRNKLLAFLTDLSEKMEGEWSDERQNNFIAFVERIIAEVGAKFEEIYNWYMYNYLDAFDFVVNTLKKVKLIKLKVFFSLRNLKFLFKF